MPCACCCVWRLATRPTRAWRRRRRSRRSAGASASSRGPFQCGTLQVPLDYDRPNGGHDRARAHAGSPPPTRTHRIGSLLINPGRARRSGRRHSSSSAGPELFTPEVRARYDLVGFDPRGISTKRGAALLRQRPPVGAVLHAVRVPDDADELDAVDRRRSLPRRRVRAPRRRDRRAHVDRERRARHGPPARRGRRRAAHLLRRLVRLVPRPTLREHVPGPLSGALVIDGVLDPVAWTTGVGDEAQTIPFSTRLHSDAGAWATLQEFFRLCDAGGDRCAFSGGAEDAMARSPRSCSTRAKVIPSRTGRPGRAQLLDPRRDHTRRHVLLARLARASRTARRLRVAPCVGSPLDPTSPRAARRYSRSPGWISNRSFPRYFNALEGFPAVACADSDNPDSYDAWSAAAVAADDGAPATSGASGPG